MMEARLETTGSFLRHPITCASLKCYLIAGRLTDVRSNDYSSHRRPILHRGGLEYRTAGCVAHGSDLGRRTRSIAADVRNPPNGHNKLRFSRSGINVDKCVALGRCA
jgi:hypothetical protein